jgi:hypothetical protein
VEDDRRQRLIGALVAGVLVIATVVVVALVLRGDPPKKVSKAKARAIATAAEAAGCKLESFPNYGRDHTGEKVAYKTNPPTSGAHDAEPAEDGEHESAPPPEKWVHSLEHGRVILQYRPGTRAREQLKEIFDGDKRHMLLMPNNTGMPYEVAAVAWRNALVCQTYDERAAGVLREFRDAYRDTAPEQVD